mgnify:CR=1 FL=1
MSKYIPPHLRSRRDSTRTSSSTRGPWTADRGDKQGASNGTRCSGRTSMDEATAHRDDKGRASGHGNHYSRSSNRSYSGQRDDSRNNREQAQCPSNLSRRWTNVTSLGSRLDITTRLEKVKTQPAPGRKAESSLSLLLSRQQQQKQSLRVAFFGDSFIGMFSLLKKHNPETVLKVHKFKGASAKGIGRIGNENRNAIIDVCELHTTIDRAVFCFGSVDVHLSYYYNKFVKREEIDLEEIATTYVDFVADLPGRSKRLVLGIYPSPLHEDIVGPSVSKYIPEIKTKEQEAEIAGSQEAIALKARQDRVRTFNRALQARCEVRRDTLPEGVELEYCDINEEIVDESTDEVKPPFKDISDYNVHIIWETTLLVWLEKLVWLRDVTPTGFAQNLQRTFDAYVVSKPWADTVHVAQEVGVRGAVVMN